MIDRLTSLLAIALLLLATTAARAEPETVYFKSADGATEIVGYLFKPSGPGPHPAIVLLHGRAGPYSSNDNEDCTLVARGVTSPCNAATLSKRHQMWGEFWAAHGVLALLPDSFGPRGKAYGFGRFTHDDPDREDVNEKTVRPLDAEGAFAYLRDRTDVDAKPIFLQGWSNGGSTALNVMIRQGAEEEAAVMGDPRRHQPNGFRAALVFYPGCGKEALLDDKVMTRTPIAMFMGTADEEVSPLKCQEVVNRSIGTTFAVSLYIGATHDFDDLGEKRQSVPANVTAKADAMAKAARMIDGFSTR
jgi:carboxymethylenebutenolidase